MHNVNAEGIRFFFNGKELKDNWRIGQCGLQDSVVIQVLVRPVS